MDFQPIRSFDGEEPISEALYELFDEWVHPVSPDAVVVWRIFGAPDVSTSAATDASISAGSISWSRSFGTPTTTTEAAAAASSITQPHPLGSPTLTTGVSLATSSFTWTRAYGQPAVTSAAAVGTSSFSSHAIGTPGLTTGVFLTVGSINDHAYGEPSFSSGAVVLPDGVPWTSSFGLPNFFTAEWNVSPDSIPKVTRIGRVFIRRPKWIRVPQRSAEVLRSLPSSTTTSHSAGTTVVLKPATSSIRNDQNES